GEYLTRRGELEKQALEQERKHQVALRARLEATLAGAMKAGNQVEVVKTQTALQKVSAELDALAEKETILDIKLSLDNEQARRDVEKFIAETRDSVLDQTGNGFAAAANRIERQRQELLRDPKYQGNAAAQDAINDNANAALIRNYYDQA